MKKLSAKKTAAVQSALECCHQAIGDLLGQASALEDAGLSTIGEDLRQVIGSIDAFCNDWHEIITNHTA